MTEPSIWINGELLLASTSGITANDHGFLLGDGVFDTLIIRNEKPIFLDRHLCRLRNGIDRLQIKGAPTDSELSTALSQLIAANNAADARLRITVTPGPGPSPRQRGTQPLTVITTSPLPDAPSSASLCTVEWTRNERSHLAGIKSTSWGENAAILRYATAKGFDNAILCDSTGRLSECTTSNLFLVIDDCIVTPSLVSGCLPGIIREVLLEENVASERDLFPSDFERATEAFITSSTTGVVPVQRIDDRAFPTDGQFTATAREAIAKLSAL
jgi:branched-chain amino acid aminotransferase